MLISKINSYSAIANNYQAKKNATTPSFKSYPSPKECFNKYSSSDFFYQYGGYRGIITYNEIMAMKNLSEKSKEKGMSPNLAIAFIADPVLDTILVTSQDEMNSKQGSEWIDISDEDAF
jgi:uncharacterized membrane protein (DUF485 family)